MTDDTRDVLAALSAPAPTDGRSLSRRRFLQAGVLGGGAAALLPSWLADWADAAAPIGPNDGVLVTVLLAGGNDGLNTVVPMDDGAYHQARGGLAIKDALPIGGGVGLHPKLAWLKGRFDAGQVAVVQGVGDPMPDLSHFTAMARWMAGDGAAGRTGWLGRYLDGLGAPDAFHGVAIGSSVPMTLVGHTRSATTLPEKVDDDLSVVHEHDWVRRAADCVRSMAAAPTGLGWYADALAATGRAAIDLTGQVAPLYAGELAQGPLARQLDLAARVVNADLGVRVLHTQLGSFDHHSGLSWAHADKLGQLDAGLRTFFERLDPRFAGRVTVVTYSEFGRRVQANASGGTDHGTASASFAVGAKVKGGLYGATPNLRALDRAGNLAGAVDFRSVYATVLDSWLRADSGAVLGGRYENLGFLHAPG